MGNFIERIIALSLDMEAYGSNLIIKAYARFPRFLPLPAHLEHGWTPIASVVKTDLQPARFKGSILVFSQRRREAWRKESHLPVAIMGAPLAIYRKMAKISPSIKATGTVAFPSHSTLTIESKFNLEKYCRDLLALPDGFHPVTICFQYPDIKLGRDKIYRQHGFKVRTAGKKLRGSLEFVANFYRILSDHRYATSNDIGSYTFYAVEMGIPFFLYGERPYVINIGMRDENIGKTARISDYTLGRRTERLFGTAPSRKITKEQAKFVSREIGLGDRLSPDEIRRFLFNQTKSPKYWLVKVPLYYLLTFLKLIVPRDLAYWLYRRLVIKSS